MKLHTFRTDQENRAKAGKGFFKLNNESIAAVYKDLVADYQALAEQHSEEVAQFLKEYDTTELEIASQIRIRAGNSDVNTTRRRIDDGRNPELRTHPCARHHDPNHSLAHDHTRKNSTGAVPNQTSPQRQR